MDAGDAAPDPERLLENVEGVRRLARRVVADEDRAEDLAQEALLQGLRTGPRRGWGLAAWLRGVVRNKAREARRADARRASHERLAPPAPPGASPPDVAAQVEVQRRLLDAVAALPEPYRSVVWMRWFLDLSPRAMARDLGVPLETVRTQLRRALERLRESLDASHGGDRRRWRLALVPFVGVGGPSIGGALSDLLSMTTRAKVAVVVAVGVLVGVLAWTVGSDGGGERDERNPVSAARDGALRSDETPGLHGRAVVADADADLPAPVDLDAVDRARDLHGVVVRKDGTAVAGAALEVVDRPWRASNFFTLRTDERVLFRTRTASDGTFVTRLTPGLAIDLRVKSEGLAEALFHMLNAGERVRLVLPPGVDLTVEVKDEQGQPVAACPVHLFRGGGGQGDAEYDAKAVTDVAGAVTFAHLLGGRLITLDARHLDLAGPGWTDFRLPAEGPARTTLVLATGRTVRGRVTDAETGAAIAGARVGSNWTASHEARTDAEGRYEYRGWTATGTEVLTAYADGYGPRWEKVGERSEVDISLRKGCRVTGRVVGPDGAPVLDALVSGRSVWVEGMNLASYPSAVTDPTGTFVLDGAQRDADLDLAIVSVHARHVERISQDRLQGATLELGEIRLGEGRWLRGVAADPSGRPVQRLLLYASGYRPERPPKGEGDSDSYVYGLHVQTYTDDLGRFTFTGLPPGPYRIGARPPGEPFVSMHTTVSADGPGDVVRFVVPVWRRLRVVVVDEEGRPLPGMQVAATGGARYAPGGATDASGVIDLALPPEVETVQIPMPTEQRDRYLGTTYHVLRPDDAEVRFVLIRASPARGRVVDESGAGIRGVHVQVLRGDGTELGVYAATENGEFQVPVPLAGDVDLVVTGKGQREVGQNTQVVDLGVTGRLSRVNAGDQDLVLRVMRRQDDRALRVTLSLPDGGAAARVQARVGPRGGVTKTVVSDEKGVALFEGLPRGPLRLSAYPPSAPRDLLRIEADVPEDRSEIGLAYRVGTRVVGTLVDESGGAFAEVWVRAYVDGRLVESARSDARGRFALLLDPEKTPLVDLSASTSSAAGLPLLAVLRGVRIDGATTPVELVARPRP